LHALPFAPRHCAFPASGQKQNAEIDQDLDPEEGVSEPVEVYEVTGLGPLRTRLQASARRGLSKLVGREAELAQMKRALELAKSGRGQIVAAVGEAGVGKSRLVFEFRGWLIRRSNTRSCSSRVTSRVTATRLPHCSKRRWRRLANWECALLRSASLPG